ncbi:MAG: hypothetical protein U7M05_07595 [Candidatus Igneacidithiobacillus chanchocoensis]
MGSAPLGGERAFDGSLEQRLAVLRERILRRFQLSHSGIEVGEQFFEFFDDASLFGARCYGRNKGLDIAKINIFLSYTRPLQRKLMSRSSEKMK